MAFKMGTRASADTGNTPAGHVSAAFAGAVLDPAMQGMVMQVEELIASELPDELKAGARDLVKSVVSKVAVAEHFDAFCGQAFSKPEWAAAASPMLAELFEHDEDQLAELARIPDLVIEMGSGQATVTCMVASRWAARGETHRLSRLGESIVASHAAKNACAVEVMLALAATLAVTRFSKAEQLFNAALPLAGDEHQEGLNDARRWLAAGRVVCSASQEERDFWDLRLRKPKTVWSWQSKEELQALETLSERLAGNLEGIHLFKAVVPACWWEMAVKCAQVQEKLVIATKKAAAAPVAVAPATATLPLHEATVASRTNLEAGRVPEKSLPPEFLPDRPQPGPYARFVLGWVCGAMATAITLFLLPSEAVKRVLNTFKGADSQSAMEANAGHAVGTPGHASNQEAWRRDNLARIAAEMEKFAPAHAKAKSGTWRENELVLSGHGEDMPYESPQYMKLLVWLHLDPPNDEEVRKQVSKLLLDRVKADAITLWEELSYPGSANVAEIKNAAREALGNSSFRWSAEEKRRLSAIADASNNWSEVSTASKE